MTKKDKLDIKTKQTGFPPKDVTKIETRIEFILGGNGGNVFWRALDDNNAQIDKGDLPIPSEIIDQWITNNNVIEDYVLTQLGLEKL